MEEERKYIVTILKKEGTCKEELFEEMAKNGDLTSTKLSELIGVDVTITGYAVCQVETNDKNFTVTYYDTEEYGLISSGSEVFLESVTRYYGKVKQVRLTEIKTKKGKTYKAQPVLKTSKKEETTKNEEEKNDNDLPF